jgi:hypothetical protein
MKQETTRYMQLWHLLAPPREESARKTKYVLLHKPHLKEAFPTTIFCQLKQQSSAYNNWTQILTLKCRIKLGNVWAET